MKARRLSAVLGVAVAAGAVVFIGSLVATNDHQARAVAARLSAPWQSWQVTGLRERGVRSEKPTGRERRREVLAAALPRPDLVMKAFQVQIDYRPGGRVLQGPPMTALVSAAAGSPYACAPLAEGRWPDDRSPEREVVCTYGAMMRFGRGTPPPLGSEQTFIGEKGATRLRIVGYLDARRLPRGWPDAFANRAAYAEFLGAEPVWVRFWKTPVSGPGIQTVETIAPQFKSDAGRDFDRAKLLLLWAAALTALSLLVNSLLLTVEARRRDLALLRVLGMTRGGVWRLLLKESFVLSAVGFVLGSSAALGSLAVWVASDPETYPMGFVASVPTLALVAAATVAVSALASLVAVRPSLAVRPLEAASSRLPRRRTAGMLVAFACGFGAFVAVEVWGASLMCAFVPSPEWPDAIVSILPGGVSSFDIARLRGRLPGVRRIHELAPLQVNLLPLEEQRASGGGRGGKAYRNALLLGSDWLPPFRFVAGVREEAERAIRSGDACVVTEMMARARGLKLGDAVRLDCGRGLEMRLAVAGIVDLNWHLVTSRALVRGLNRMPSGTDGPLFVSFDTVEACDARPAALVKMTHLWLDYEPAFLAEHGAFEAGRRVEREIVEALGLLGSEVGRNAVRLHSRDEIAEGTLAHGNDIVGSMARVPFVFVAVLALGFVAMLVASAEARRREFRVLRAVGAQRSQLVGVLVREALKLAIAGIALALPLGALVGWLFTAGTRAAMANWGLPPSFAFPVLTIAKGAFGAVAFALLVAVPAAAFVVLRQTRSHL